MAAECNVGIIATVTGLGKALEFIEKFSSITPERQFYQYMVQTTTNEEEALAVGDVGTPELIILKCVANDVDIDTSYVDSFNAEIEVQEGQTAIFKPTGFVYIKNDDEGEVSTIEYIIVGTENGDE